ncbi:MAG: cytochrome P450 [Rubripirellula sp.]
MIVEEVLRFESPAQATMRIATRDCEIADVAIRKGDGVVAGLAAANRYPKVFD